MAFKVGDKVRVIRASSACYNCIAVVEAVLSPAAIRIKAPSWAGWLTFADYELEHVSAPPSVSMNISGGVQKRPYYSFFGGGGAPVDPDEGIDNATFSGGSLEEAFDELRKALNNIKCECGCSSIGVSNHSDYCPLYTKGSI